MHLPELFEHLHNSQLKPYFFGLGFIQVKVSESLRFHFYHSTLNPIINYEEEVHDHRYDFDSTILKGFIVNKKYRFLKDIKNDYYMKSETCNPNIHLTENPEILGTLELLSTKEIITGDTYHMNFDELHTVNSTNCISKLYRSGYKQEHAHVVRQVGGDEICPFSKQLSQIECWELIRDMCY